MTSPGSASDDRTAAGGQLAEEPEGSPQADNASDMPEAFVIPRALAQATLNYLAAQPYREVFSLVQAFESLQPLSSGHNARVDHG